MSDMDESLGYMVRKAKALRDYLQSNFYAPWMKSLDHYLMWRYARDRQPYHIRRYYDRFYRDRYPWLRQGKRPRNDGRAIARLLRRKPRHKARFGSY